MPGGRSAASAPLNDEPHRPAGPSLRSIPPDVVAARGGFGTGSTGETSGNRLRLRSLHPDCDGDALLIVAEPEGPTCHRGSDTCFEGDQDPATTLPWLGRMETLLQARKASADLSGTYTQKLFAQGLDRIAKKITEEAGEVVIAAKNHATDPSEAHREELLGEAADLFFHIQMVLVERGLGLQDVVRVLQQRHAKRALEHSN